LRKTDQTAEFATATTSMSITIENYYNAN